MAALMIPPLNFEHVSPGVFRSGFPTRRNVDFMRKLGLRCIVRLCKDKYSPEVAAYMKAVSIRVVDCITEGNKEPFKCIPQRIIRKALVALSNAQYHPVLVHCSNGQQTTGCIVGCLRKAQGWALSAVFDEYRRHTAKVRALDLQCIELSSVHGVSGLQRDALLETDPEEQSRGTEDAAPMVVPQKDVHPSGSDALAGTPPAVDDAPACSEEADGSTYASRDQERPEMERRETNNEMGQTGGDASG
eukprot:CAMPEP_0206038096 /NCGR_PEP_ID=MMETSP1466-20131121/3889_1 /ASSEMBLY_ACC=CAM_ASM_001126 /TAXON_ID=44452 /ORGANISM="Pavlova gyrans, Strain CCMP608" /LENGTH=245 /DNA_ID=CAMNT_0053412683 /DNA_START=15 /DNA_END=752 /DNA_ORIENTATION=+